MFLVFENLVKRDLSCLIYHFPGYHFRRSVELSVCMGQISGLWVAAWVFLSEFGPEFGLGVGMDTLKF